VVDSQETVIVLERWEPVDSESEVEIGRLLRIQTFLPFHHPSQPDFSQTSFQSIDSSREVGKALDLRFDLDCLTSRRNWVMGRKKGNELIEFVEGRRLPKTTEFDRKGYRRKLGKKEQSKLVGERGLVGEEQNWKGCCRK